MVVSGVLLAVIGAGLAGLGAAYFLRRRGYKVKVYEAFIEGAKEGFDVAKSLLPYLVAMLCARS